MAKMNDIKKIVLATGGTGGHIFPALSLKAKLIHHGKKVSMIVDNRYKNYVKDYDIDTYFLPVDHLNKASLFTKLSAIVKLYLSLLKAFFLLIKIKPHLVIGFGGYTSLPTIIAAKLLNIKTIIHEQNSVLGRANKFLANYVDKIALSFPEIIGLKSKHLNKTIIVGNLVRDEISKIKSAPYLPIKEDGFMEILVIGGSQGASIFSEIIPKAIALLPTELIGKIKIKQQTRLIEVEETKAKYQQIGINAQISTFFENIERELVDASIVIARAGASTIFELIASARPAILVPYPSSSLDHQFYNASYYEKIGAGLLINQVDFNEKTLSDILYKLLTDKNILHKYANNAKKSYIDDSDKLLYLIDNLINQTIEFC